MRHVSSSAAAAFLVSFLASAMFGACGDNRSRCARIVCDASRVCDEATGACVRVDGLDGGSDAGTCTPACVSPRKCDTASGACVDCLADSDCQCPTPSCSAHSCVAAAADAGLPTPGETCASATTLPSCRTSMSFSVDLSTATDDLQSSGCSSPGGKDVTYRLTLHEVSDVRVTAKPSSGSTAEPVISLRQLCDAATELACMDSLGGTADFRVKSLPAGSYIVVVDSFDAPSAGPVDVTVDLLPPTLPGNDLCSTAAELPLDGGAVSTDLRDATDDVQLSCNTEADSPDVFYRFTLSTPSDVRMIATGAPDAGVDSVLAIRAAPCASGAFEGCADNLASSPETLRVRNLPAGTYYAVLESYGRSHAGPVTLTATATTPQPPPGNDTCASPRMLTFPPGVDTLTLPSVNTANASDDTSGSCNSAASSPELVYELILSAARTVTVTSEPATGSNADAVIYLRSGACDADGGVEEACDDGYPSDTFTKALPPGTYFLFVEGYGASGAGPTKVTITLTP